MRLMLQKDLRSYVQMISGVFECMARVPNLCGFSIVILEGTRRMQYLEDEIREKLFPDMRER